MDPDISDAGAKAFGKALREARKAKGWSQKRLGQALNVDQSAVSAWERAVNRLTKVPVDEIEEALGPAICPPGRLRTKLYGVPATPGALQTPRQLVQEIRRLLGRLERWATDAPLDEPTDRAGSEVTPLRPATGGTPGNGSRGSRNLG